MKKRPLTESKSYESFMESRDHALEEILQKYQLGIGQIVKVLQQHTESVANHLSTKYQGKENAKRAREDFEFRLSPFFNMAIEQAAFLFERMRTSIYVLSGAGQAEAMGRALDKPQAFTAHRQKLDEHREKNAPSGGSIHARIDLAFHRLLRDILDAFHLSQALESTPKELLERIDRAFPKSRKIRKRAPMASMTESGRTRDSRKSPEFYTPEEGISKQDWDAAIDDYKDTYIPYGRGLYDAVFYPVEYSKTGDVDLLEAPQWELEQELIEDFVQSVRSGENEAAAQNGITDFIVIAVIDSATDECCVARDGMTTAEIEAQVDSLPGDCDGNTPPFHFKCRCRTAPMTDDMPEKQQPDFGGFDEWLRSKEEE